MGHIEEDALQEEDEGYPLVVGLDLDVVPGGVVGTHPGLGDPIAQVRLVVHVVLGHGESADNVAVVVDDVRGDGARVEAVDDGVGAWDMEKKGIDES